MERDEGSRTIDCLRGRLLAERVASRAAKEEADSLAIKLKELEKKLRLEIKCRDKAEKKLNCVVKKLESLRLSDLLNQITRSTSEGSGSSVSCVSSSQEPEVTKSYPGNVGITHGNLQLEDPKEQNPVFINGFNLESGTGSTNGSIHHVSSHDGSWSPEGTTESGLSIDLHQEVSLPPKERNNTEEDAIMEEGLRGLYLETDGEEKEAHNNQDNTLALVPSSCFWCSSGHLEPQINIKIYDVLVALRNARDCLQSSLDRRKNVLHSGNF